MWSGVHLVGRTFKSDIKISTHKGTQSIFLSLSVSYKHSKFSLLYLLQEIFCAFCSFHKHLLNSLGVPALPLDMVRSTKKSLAMRAKKSQIMKITKVTGRDLKKKLEQDWIWRRGTLAPLLASTQPRCTSEFLLCAWCLSGTPENTTRARQSFLLSPILNISFRVLWHPSFQAFLNLVFACIHQITQLDARSHACPFPAGLTV